MATFNEQLVQIVEDYRAGGNPWPATRAQIAEWAVAHDRYSLTRGMVIDSWMASAVARRCGGQALGVEAGDQMRDGIAGTAAGRACGGLVVLTPGDGQEHGRPGDLGGGCGLGSAEVGQ